jgi:ribosomal protein S18 acetylase RimI-like enzyme
VTAPRWRVRPARAADRDALLELWREVDELHAELQPGFFRPDYERVAHVTERVRAAQLSSWQSLLVADDADGLVCGLAWLQIYDTPPSASMVQRRRVHVEDLVVARARRRAGCGRALLEAGAAWARQRGAEQLLLTVWAGNHEAELFYQSLGYRPISQVLGTDL